MDNTIKNPAPTAIGDRAYKLVKVRNTDKHNITPNRNAQQRLVLESNIKICGVR
jgi:hypothetical protein